MTGFKIYQVANGWMFQWLDHDVSRAEWFPDYDEALLRAKRAMLKMHESQAQADEAYRMEAMS